MPKPFNPGNLIHQRLLAALIETKPVSWSHKRFDPTRSAELSAQSADGSAVKRHTDDLVKTTVTGTALANPLAGNVSALNVERAAKRWIR